MKWRLRAFVFSLVLSLAFSFGGRTVADQLSIVPGESFGDRYGAVLDQSIEDMHAEISRLFEGVKAGDAAQLERLKWLHLGPNAYKELRDMDESGKFDFVYNNIHQVDAYIKRTLDKTYVSAIEGAYEAAISATDEDFDNLGYFKPVDLDLFKQTKLNDSVWFQTANKEAAQKVHEALARWSISGSVLSLKAFELPEVMDQWKVKKYGPTIVRSHISSFYRQASMIRGANAGVKKYAYVGATPRREFCQKCWGRTFHVDEIMKMDNGQTGNVMLTMGGYNCVHRWKPVIGDSEAADAAPSRTATEKRLKDLGIWDSGVPEIAVQNEKGETIGVIRRKVFQDKAGKFFYRRSWEEGSGAQFVDSLGEGQFKLPAKAKIRGLVTGEPVTAGMEKTPLLVQKLAEQETRIRALSTHEVATGYSLDGAQLFSKTGEARSVSFTNDELKLFKDAVITHNHPGGFEYPVTDPRWAGASFSDHDVRLAMASNALEIRAVGPGATYVLRRPAGGWDLDYYNETVLPSANNHMRKAHIDWMEKALSGTPVDIQHLLWGRVFKDLELTYYRIETEDKNVD